MFAARLDYKKSLDVQLLRNHSFMPDFQRRPMLIYRRKVNRPAQGGGKVG
jgi:hypothetical protein